MLALVVPSVASLQRCNKPRKGPFQTKLHTAIRSSRTRRTHGERLHTERCCPNKRKTQEARSPEPCSRHPELMNPSLNPMSSDDSEATFLPVSSSDGTATYPTHVKPDNREPGHDQFYCTSDALRPDYTTRETSIIDGKLCTGVLGPRHHARPPCNRIKLIRRRGRRVCRTHSSSEQNPTFNLLYNVYQESMPSAVTARQQWPTSVCRHMTPMPSCTLLALPSPGQEPTPLKKHVKPEHFGHAPQRQTTRYFSPQGHEPTAARSRVTTPHNR